jgi:DNA-binding SARP family transcriptional activator/predicted ATPase/Tfp pilus assembly protein PilF
MSRNLQIHLFGTPSITLDGAPVTGFISNKSVATVYYLAATGRTQARTVLATLLWTNSPDIYASKNLRNVLSNLRDLLGPFLDITRNEVTLNRAAPVFVDVLRFDDLLTESQQWPVNSAERRARLAEAAALYQGPFLDGFYVAEAEGFDEWVRRERERYLQLVNQVLRELVADSAHRRAYLEGLGYATRQLALDPLEEETHRQIMSMYTASGQYAAVLAQYEQCCRILYDELGAEPSAETTALFERLQTLQSGPRHNLPAEAHQAAFVGRERELAEIEHLLANRACRLLTLIGLGGAGKTRLALQVASNQLTRYLDGVYWIALEPLEAQTQLISTLAQALNLLLAEGEQVGLNTRLTGPQSARQQLINFLRNKELLLVLDGIEVAANEAPPAHEMLDLLGEIARSAPGVQLLATARERLNLRSEWLYEVEGLALPNAALELEVQRQTVLQNSAVQLFLQSARRMWANFAPTDAAIPADELQAIVHICRLVGGMPLAIELAAGWVQALSCRAIAAEIERGIDLLETTLYDMPARHRSLRAVFDQSWRLLPPPEQQAIMHLSIFAGSFTREAARAVADASLATLMNLTQRTLLRRDSTDRYDIHRLLRQYGLEKLAASPEQLLQTSRRHCQYYLAQVQSWQHELKHERVEPYRALIDADLENIRTAFKWGVRHEAFEQIDAVLDPIYQLYELSGRSIAGEELFHLVLTQLEPTEPSALAGRQNRSALVGRLQTRLGLFHLHLGRFRAAQQALQQGLTSAQVHADLDEAAICQLGLAGVAYYQGVYEAAITHAEASLAHAQQVDDAIGQVRAWIRLGEVALATGEYRRARQVLAQAQSLAQEQRLERAEAECLEVLGRVSWNQGDYAGAKRFYQRAVVIFHDSQITNPRAEANVLRDLGFVCWSQGEYEVAATYHHQALRISRQIGDRQGEATTLSELGRVFERQRDFKTARHHYEQALTIMRQIGDRQGEAITLSNLGFITYHQADYQRAEDFFARCLNVCLVIGFRRYESMALACLGLLRSLLGRYAEGEQLAQAALEVAQAIRDPTIQGYAFTHLGHALVGQGRFDEAAAAFDQALRFRRASGDEGRALEPLAGLAYVKLQQGQHIESYSDVQAILDFLRTGSLTQNLMPLQIYFVCHQVLQAVGDPRAEEIWQQARAMLEEQAAAITDPAQRRVFLEEVVVHRLLAQSAG